MARFFDSYVPPAVYAEVKREVGTITPSGFARVPFLVGIGREVRQIDNYELHRGASSTGDYFIEKEDLSSQADGTNQDFLTSFSPITDGKGNLVTDVFDVTITVDGRSVQPLYINAAAGLVRLAIPPSSTSKVLITYYFDTQDNFIPKEDLTGQVATGNKNFYVGHPVITDGTNSGMATTNTSAVKVYVNDVLLAKEQITQVDGNSGLVQLATDPAFGQTVKISYYRANWVDTFDVLPSQNVASILRVGDGPDQAKYIPGVDYVLKNNRVIWGTSFTMIPSNTLPGSTPISATNAQILLKDQWLVGQEAAETPTGTLRTFTVSHPIMDGTGLGKESYSPSSIRVYVGTDPTSARAAGTKEVVQISSENQAITLYEAPLAGTKVFVDYYTSFIADEAFTLRCNTTGGVGLGTYLILNDRDEIVPAIDQTLASVADPDFATEGITMNPLGQDFRVTPGYSVAETITVTFTTATTFTVTSSNPSGSAGTGNLNQTYRDGNTGVVFTIMSGLTTTYATNDTITFEVSTSPRPVNPSKPVLDIMGLQILVPTMESIAVDNSVVIETYRKTGQEPLVGSYYFVSYLENKVEDDYGVKFWSNADLPLLLAEYGKVSLQNELSLAASLCFDSGAQFLATIQVRTDPVSGKMTTEEVKRAIRELEHEYAVDAFYVCPLTADPDHLALFQAHQEKMSSLRYSRPRLLTMANNTSDTYLDVLGTLSARTGVNNINFWPTDPVMKLISDSGVEQEYVVPAYMISASYCGMRANPAYDSAEPMTRKLIPWFAGLVTRNDPVKQNLMASKGCTVLENYQGTVRIRDEVTTDISSVTRSEVPAASVGVFLVHLIKLTLDKYIGKKALEGINNDIRRDVSITVESLKPNVLSAVHGVKVEDVPGDPTMRYVEAEVTPVLTLKRIVVRFSYKFA